MTKGVNMPNGMTGLGRKLIHSFVSNVRGKLKEVFVDQRNFVSYRIGVSQGTVDRVTDKEIQRWEEEGDWLRRDEKRSWEPWLVIFNSEEGGGLE